MNILLINPPIREHMPPYFQPMGLAIVANMLRNEGHEVAIFDINCLRYSKEEVAELLPANDWGMIGVSGLITTYKYLLWLVPLLREMFDVPIVIGGAGITSAHETYMQYLRPDYGVLGEGEYTAVELVYCLEQDLSPQDILGITYFDGDELITNSPRPLEQDLDKFPAQAFDLLDMETYITNVRHNPGAQREVGIIATRGCPMSCNYCYHIFGVGVRYRSAQAVVDEMEYFVEYRSVNLGAEASHSMYPPPPSSA